jgi:hypothetical protein
MTSSTSAISSHLPSWPNDREVTDTVPRTAKESGFGLNLILLLILGCAHLYSCVFTMGLSNLQWEQWEYKFKSIRDSAATLSVKLPALQVSVLSSSRCTCHSTGQKRCTEIIFYYHNPLVNGIHTRQYSARVCFQCSSVRNLQFVSIAHVLFNKCNILYYNTKYSLTVIISATSVSYCIVILSFMTQDDLQIII